MLDELNVLKKQKKPTIIPIEQYFGEMDLTEEQTKERVLFALRFRALLMIVFSYAELGDYETAESRLAEGYREISQDFFKPGDKFAEYIAFISASVIATTKQYIEDAYYTSIDRATFIAENEANTTLNNADLQRAVDAGKTMKTWHTMKDNRVRHTHKNVDGKTIPIDSMFSVGSVLMRYPKDYENDAFGAETVNCRCTIKYK